MNTNGLENETKAVSQLDPTIVAVLGAVVCPFDVPIRVVNPSM